MDRRTARPGRRVATPLSATAGVVALLLLGATPAAAGEPQPPPDVALEALPAAARQALPLIVELTAARCPELPPSWVIAQVQAESGWDPALASGLPGGAAGLYQFSEPNWLAAGGATWPSDPPGQQAPVTDTADHLRIAIPWVCANLRAVTTHLLATGKPTSPLDAMLVCHIAGCGRVTGSASGVPAAGEAGCRERCAQVISRYLAAVHANLERFAPSARAASPAPEPAATPASEPTQPPARATNDGPAPAPAPAPAAPPPPSPGQAPGAPPGAEPAPPPTAWTGGSTGCTLPDPTGDGCLTGAAAHGLAEAGKAFGGWSGGPVVRSAGCWDAHRWNPRSDHPRGKACDLFPTTPGTFAAGAELDGGWRLANWLREHAAALAVKYLIWQGRYWDQGVKDDGGWGRRYTGGGVYDVRNATGGHFDHVHVSFRE